MAVKVLAAVRQSGAESRRKGFWKNISFNTVKFDSDGDLGYHVGQYSADVPTGDGGTAREKGKFIDIYKRLPDGSWKIHVTMFNSDAA